MAEPDVTEPLIDTNAALLSYYDSLESRIGYRLLLGGTRHLGTTMPARGFPSQSAGACAL